MTTQEQLEKIIEFYVGSLIPDKHKKELASACASFVFSAIRIDEEILRVVIDKELASNVTWRHIDFPDDFDYDRIMTRIFYDISKAIASHAQEIIKFGDE